MFKTLIFDSKLIYTPKLSCIDQIRALKFIFIDKISSHPHLINFKILHKLRCICILQTRIHKHPEHSRDMISTREEYKRVGGVRTQAKARQNEKLWCARARRAGYNSIHINKCFKRAFAICIHTHLMYKYIYIVYIPSDSRRERLTEDVESKTKSSFRCKRILNHEKQNVEICTKV